MVNTIWKERKSKTEANIAAVEELTEECGLTPLSARLLVKRGYDTADKAMEMCIRDRYIMEKSMPSRGLPLR